MAQTSELREHAAPRVEQPTGAEVAAGAWAKIKHVCVRSIFWTYKRGSWQYDVIVLVNLAFIFLTPRSWYTPQPAPQVTGFLKNQGIIQVGQIQEGLTYIVDARLVQSRASKKPEDAVREILSQRLEKPVTIKSVGEIRDKNKVVIGYTVAIEP